MEWADEGVVLSVRAHGETSVIAELFTRTHGRHLGLVHGGRGRTKRPILQPGNHVTAHWRARLHDQLGSFTLEMKHPLAAELIERRNGLLGLECLTTLARLLPERDPHPSLFEVTLFVMGFLSDDAIWPALYARWELALLEELGYGLDLSACAVTGSNDYLAYVSPRTGRAVSMAAAEPYKDKLLPLPGLLIGGGAGKSTASDVLSALRLTGHFLARDVLSGRGMELPSARWRLIDSMHRPE
jgi:DNA repair protein RecO (recombination protein O)